MAGKVVVAIGNYGTRYIWTRHNIGFLLADMLVQGAVFKSVPSLFSLVAKTTTTHGSLIVIKPTTYVNLTGKAVASVKKHYGIDSKQMLVLADDVNHAFGSVRLRWQGGSGGHKGLKSIRDALSSSDYWQLRLGVGRPADDRMGLADFVLGEFSKQEREQLPTIFNEAQKLFFEWLSAE